MSTATYPEAIWTVVALLGLVITWRLCGTSQADCALYHGDPVWGVILGARLRNARVRFASFCGFTAIGGFFLMIPDPIVTEVYVAVQAAGAILLAIEVTVLYAAIKDTLERSFVLELARTKRSFEHV